MMNKITHELKTIASLALFFAICFGYILLLIKILSKDYAVDGFVLTKTIIYALFASKAILLINATPLFRHFRDLPLYIGVIYRTILYTLAASFFVVLEGIFEAYQKTKAIAPAILEFMKSQHLHQRVAIILCLGVVFLLYSMLKEIDISLGKGGLRKFFLTIPANPNNRQ